MVKELEPALGATETKVSYILMSDLAGLNRGGMGDSASATAAANQFWAANRGGGATVASCVSNLNANTDESDADVQAACQATFGSAAGQAAAQATCPAGQVMTVAGCMSQADAQAAGVAPSTIDPNKVFDVIGKAFQTGFGVFGAIKQAQDAKAAARKPIIFSGPTGVTTGGGLSTGTILLIGLGAVVVIGAGYLLTREQAPQQPVYIPAPAPAPAPTPAPVVAAPLARNSCLPLARNKRRVKRHKAA